MKLPHLLLLGVSLLPLTCRSSIPDARQGGRISGVVRYDGKAHLAFSRPALEVFASVMFPPPALPHGVLVIEKPDFGQGGIPYELANLPVYRFKVAARLVDLDSPQPDLTQVALGGYPDTCMLLVPDAGLVDVDGDNPITGIDIRIFDPMADPCIAELDGLP
jgi:hypothetical protein